MLQAQEQRVSVAHAHADVMLKVWPVAQQNPAENQAKLGCQDLFEGNVMRSAVTQVRWQCVLLHESSQVKTGCRVICWAW